MSNELEKGSNQIDSEVMLNDQPIDEEVIVENEAKPRKKRAIEEDDNDMKDSDNSINIQSKNEDQKSKTVEFQENFVPQELIKKLFQIKRV